VVVPLLELPVELPEDDPPAEVPLDVTPVEVAPVEPLPDDPAEVSAPPDTPPELALPDAPTELAAAELAPLLEATPDESPAGTVPWHAAIATAPIDEPTHLIHVARKLHPMPGSHGAPRPVTLIR
jgi:hypothetical protein